MRIMYIRCYGKSTNTGKSQHLAKVRRLLSDFCSLKISHNNFNIGKKYCTFTNTGCLS